MMIRALSTCALAFLTACATRRAEMTCAVCRPQERLSDACMKDQGCSQCGHAQCDRCGKGKAGPGSCTCETTSPGGTCAQCGKKSQGGSTTCPDCAARTHTTRCPSCGSEKKHETCPTCGTCKECEHRR